MKRTPPTHVKKILREEVLFGCPIPGCGNPYLEYHHFNPAWNIRNHHEPNGMIALCQQHHKEADFGAFTKEQLFDFKSNAQKNSSLIKGKFNWMRHKILAIIGGNYYYETPIIFQYKKKPVIWFERDLNNYLLLNLHMLTTSCEPRAYIRNNEWFNTGYEEDIECSPTAKKLKIRYSNGDFIGIEFSEIEDIKNLENKYPSANIEYSRLSFPITTLEITYKGASPLIEFNPNETKIINSKYLNCFFHNCGIGLHLE